MVMQLSSHQNNIIVCIYVIGSFLKNRIIAHENYQRVHYCSHLGLLSPNPQTLGTIIYSLIGCLAPRTGVEPVSQHACCGSLTTKPNEGFGASGENRTRIFCLEGRRNSQTTTDALAGVARFELANVGIKVRCLNQLGDTPIVLAEGIGFEPMQPFGCTP